MQEEQEKREVAIRELAADMASIDVHEIAVRTVSVLICCKGHLNHYSEAIEIVLAAHRRAVLREAAKVIRDNHVLHTADGAVLRPRAHGSVEALAYAEELERMANG